MLIREFEDRDSRQLAAIGQFLLKRAEDTSATKKISVNTFIQLAANNGISLTKDRLMALAQQQPLSNIIANIEGDNIVFKGEEPTTGTDTMSVDQARATVDQMAKRATQKRI